MIGLNFDYYVIVNVVNDGGWVDYNVSCVW